jgi:hypothetical protein
MPKTTSKTTQIQKLSSTSTKITLQESNLSDATKTEYIFRLGQFYKIAPISNDDELIDCPSDELQNILLNYLRFLLKKVASDELSANTVPKMFRGIRWLLNSNYRENDIKWKPLESMFPKSVKRTGYKAWTSKQVEAMIENTSSLRNKAVIHFQASTGARLGVHDHPILMKHLVKMYWNGHECYAIILYADSEENVEEKDMRDKMDDVQSGDSYWAFLTPEATGILDRYFEDRKSHGETLMPSTPIFIKDDSRKSIDSSQLSDENVKSIVFNIVYRVPELKRKKTGRRHDIQINHGMRKRFNTILKLESDVNSNIAEKIMGHKNGLDGVYLAPTREQCFKEFVKGIPELTVSDTLRQKIVIDNKSKQINELEQARNEMDDFKRDMLSKIADLEKENMKREILAEQTDIESRKKVAKLIKKSQKKVSADKIEQILELLASP